MIASLTCPTCALIVDVNVAGCPDCGACLHCAGDQGPDCACWTGAPASLETPRSEEYPAARKGAAR
jgi:hypothetical protein